MPKWTAVLRIASVMQASTDQRLILVLQSDSTLVSVIQAAISDEEHPPNLMAIADSQAALDFLHRQGAYTTAQRPHLILLDLELGEKNESHQLLTTLKSDAQLRRIPIIVLAQSDCPDEIFNVYAAQGNCYVVRSGDRDQLIQIMRRIEEFWLNIVTLPQE